PRPSPPNWRPSRGTVLVTDARSGARCRGRSCRPRSRAAYERLRDARSAEHGDDLLRNPAQRVEVLGEGTGGGHGHHRLGDADLLEPADGVDRLLRAPGPGPATTVVVQRPMLL